MAGKKERYAVNGVNLFEIRNRNEVRVAKKMRELLESMDNPELSPGELRDSYALALNSLPARYSQSGTIVLREPVRESHLREAVSQALRRVLDRPKG